MPAFPREEIEQAFSAFQERAVAAASSGDWTIWADVFTDDATYIEHYLGRFRGRDEILAWISKTMATWPNDSMISFPVEWYVVDEEKGWVICCLWNVMEDPGDGNEYKAANWTLLKYAGNGKWNWEEDIYNPNEFADMITAWAKAKRP